MPVYRRSTLFARRKGTTQRKRGFLSFISKYRQSNMSSIPSSRGYRSSRYSSVSGDNRFLYQVIGVGTLLAAMVLLFQNFFDASSTTAAASASILAQQDVRMVTNFQTAPKATTSSSTIFFEEIKEVPIKSIADFKDTNQRYTVISGDTLDEIAQKFGIQKQIIIQVNNLQAPYNLQTGEEIVIP